MAADVLTPRVARASAAILLTIYVNSSSLDGKYVRRDKQFLFPHDDVIKWKHFPRYWPFVRGIHRSPVNSTHKGQWRGAFMFSLICVWINGWVNNRKADDLSRYRAHYDVTVMIESHGCVTNSSISLIAPGGDLGNGARPRWMRPSDAYMRHWTKLSLIQIMNCPLFGAKPLSEPMLAYCQLDI